MAKKIDKKNPNSLRELLTEIRRYSGLDQGAFAAALSKYGRGYGKVKFSVRTLGKIERDEEYIKYLHIEKYAEYLGIPSGLLLLASRMRANARNGNTQENNRELATGIIEIFRLVSEESKFPVEQILAWKGNFNRQQLTLPLPSKTD